MTRRVRYSPEALVQLDDLEFYLIERAGDAMADAYLDRLLDFCEHLGTDPVVGHHRDHLLPGLMTRTFEKNRVVCFLTAGTDDLHVLAIYGAHQDWERHLHNNPPGLP